MSLASFLVLLGMALTSLGCAIYMLTAQATNWNRILFVVWVVFSTVLVYVVLCTAWLTRWRRRAREKRRSSARQEALNRGDAIFRIHVQRSQEDSAIPRSTTIKSPLKNFYKTTRPHPGGLSSNPPYGPPFEPPSSPPFHLPPLPNNLSDLALSMPQYHTASTVIITPAHSRAVQIPARPRAATDAGITTAAAASRTRANSLLRIKEATARRMTAATPVTPPRSATLGAFDFDS